MTFTFTPNGDMIKAVLYSLTRLAPSSLVQLPTMHAMTSLYLTRLHNKKYLRTNEIQKVGKIFECSGRGNQM